MTDIQKSNNEYAEILDDLNRQTKDAQDILDVLNPLIDGSKMYKEVFETIKLDIEESHKEIRSSKSANTKYSKELTKTKEQIEDFLKESHKKQDYLRKLITSIGDLEKKASARFNSIETLKSDANESKKLVTVAKNDAEGLVLAIRKMKDESFDNIKEIRTEKKESERIQKILRNREKDVQNIFEKINEKYLDLFAKEKGKESKVEKLNSNIQNINTFNNDLESKVKKNLDEKMALLKTIEDDITLKQNEISLLLSDATVKTLAQGYLESMEEYSYKKKLPFVGLKLKRNFISYLFKNSYVLFFNLIGRYINSFVNYLIFILPLVFVCFIFIESDVFKEFFKINHQNVTFTGIEFSLYKALVSLPLLWISWFGQKNISQRKRLFEEYNHKLRVVQMYLMFISKNSYSLSNRDELETILLNAIKTNPAEHLGRGETMIDNLFEKIRMEGFYKRLKKEIMDDIKHLIPKD